MNGGFFVLEPAVLDRIDGDDIAVRAASRSRASPPTASCVAFRHRGFWQPMDALRDSVRCRPSGTRAKRRGPSGRASDAARDPTCELRRSTDQTVPCLRVGRARPAVCAAVRGFRGRQHHGRVRRRRVPRLRDVLRVRPPRSDAILRVLRRVVQVRPERGWGTGLSSSTRKRYEDEARFIADARARSRQSRSSISGRRPARSSSRFGTSVSRAFTASNRRLKPPVRARDDARSRRRSRGCQDGGEDMGRQVSPSSASSPFSSISSNRAPLLREIADLLAPDGHPLSPGARRRCGSAITSTRRTRSSAWSTSTTSRRASLRNLLAVRGSGRRGRAERRSCS